MSILRLIFRGALGGLIGGPLFLIGLTLHDIFRLGYTPYGGFLQIMALPFMLVGGLISGSIIGCLVWIIECKPEIHLPMIVRAILGASFVFILFSAISVLMEDNKWHPAPSGLESFVNGVMFLTTLGVLPAILTRPTSAASNE
jgi:hypothetical protein